jgi:hypothetical protein
MGLSIRFLIMRIIGAVAVSTAVVRVVWEGKMDLHNVNDIYTVGGLVLIAVLVVVVGGAIYGYFRGD